MAGQRAAYDVNGLSELTDADLVRTRAFVEGEMKRRGLAFSVGEIGEQLAIEWLQTTPRMPKLQRAPKGTKNVDALSREGHRYSIKSIWNAKKTGTIYPDADDRDRKLFEHLLVVQLNNDLELSGIWRLSWDTFVAVRKWDRRMNAWYVTISKLALDQAERFL